MDKPRSGGSGGRRLTRQTSSRLQMHAPSSLKVAHAGAGADVAGWNAAIPLLSPLDAASRGWDAAEHECRREERRRQPAAAAAAVGTTLTATAAAAVEAKREEATAATASAWKHPAAPFYYEPAPPAPDRASC